MTCIALFIPKLSVTFTLLLPSIQCAIFCVSADLKGTLVYGVGRYITEFNITDDRLMTINGDASSIVVSVDVDSTQSHVYWVDGQQIRRAAIPKNPLQIPVTQTLCDVVNAQGIAFDWLNR